MARISVPIFNLANPLYAGASVTFWTVSGGVKTAVSATLYAGLTGATTLANPQTLDGEGKLAAPVYIEVPVIATVVGFNVDAHDTGIIGNSSIRLPSYTVALLPSGAAGDLAFATNCRVFNGAGTQEGAGVGTGGLVTHNGTAWKIAGTNVTAVA